ncbi:hypothetical protein VTH82DRAFT_4889 [Thermothelomyces myriococcoides]
MYLRKLQWRLVQHVADMRFRNVEPRDWEKDLQAYMAGPWEEDSIAIGGTRSENRIQSRLAQFRGRTMMAVIGGAFLVGPMWLMMLHRNLYTSLVTTTVCVAVFGLIIALFLEKPMEVLSGTAAYAAVLVVFVGGLSN